MTPARATDASVPGELPDRIAARAIDVVLEPAIEFCDVEVRDVAHDRSLTFRGPPSRFETAAARPPRHEAFTLEVSARQSPRFYSANMASMRARRSSRRPKRDPMVPRSKP